MQSLRIPSLSDINPLSNRSFFVLYAIVNILSLGDALSTMRDIKAGFSEGNFLLSFLGKITSFSYAVAFSKIMFALSSTILVIVALRTHNVREKKISILT